MPQATLRAYFLPSPQIEPKSQPLLHTTPAEDQPSVEPPQLSSTLNTIAEETSGVPRSVLESVDQEAFGNGCLDFFVPPHQPKAAIVKILPAYLPRLKNITATLLPVRYPDKFYNECLEIDTVSDLSRVVLWNSQPVGWIRCQLEDNDQGSVQIYIQALGLLAPYRGIGLATRLLGQVTRPEVVRKYNITSTYCHVWELNRDALEWYEKLGFKRIVLVDQYYRKLKPQGAWVMRKDSV